MERIGLFGSFARDNFENESDVDIVVKLLKPDIFI
ncbi:MAG: nucleotidyltransferase domain-containing protein [Bacteroidales bacterium]|nr:nucleotidyltransferase domain-containing protein [Bacteroidales bacterium]